MKKYIYIILSLFLMPILVNAEPMVYNVCKSGCEYNNLNDIIDVWNAGECTDSGMQRKCEGLIINILDNEQYEITTKYANKLSSGLIYDRFEINGVNVKPTIVVDNPETAGLELVIGNLKITSVNIIGEQGESSDPYVLRKANVFFAMGLEGNVVINETPGIIDIENANIYQLNIGYGNATGTIKDSKIEELSLSFSTSDISIYNSEFNTIVHQTSSTNILNIYNSTFDFFEYNKFDFNNSADVQRYINHINNVDKFSGIISFSLDGEYNTFVHYGSDKKIVVGESFNFIKEFDYLEEDKDINYSIDNRSITKIERNIITGLNAGTTKIVGTTDDGHIIYTLNLVVEKEGLPEKIDKMTIKVPITGSKVKAWVVVVSILLLGIIGVCSYMLIKRKK